MSKGRQLPGPGILAEEGQHGHLIAADLESRGHGQYPLGTRRHMAGFDRRPLGELHAGQPGAVFNRAADHLTAVLDHAAEQLAESVAAGGEEGC